MVTRVHSESARQRELYKYWQPNEQIFPSAQYDESFNRDYTPRPSYDAALTAYAQLGALRCNAKRGMISVVDQDFQYIIAEGTKTLSLQDGSVVDDDDQLWFGLRTIPRQMGICARALGQFTTTPGLGNLTQDATVEPLQFVIPDLSKDARFESQPFVCGVPYLRFYAGVPIYSPAGYIIGIYSIVDDKPRNQFGERDLNILKDLAATVMDHLVLGTTRIQQYKAGKMVKGIGLFVDGKSSLRDWWLQTGHLSQGPATKDGSRGEWTLKAQAEAEFGTEESEMIESRPNEIMRDEHRGNLGREGDPKPTTSFPVVVHAPSNIASVDQHTKTNSFTSPGIIEDSLLYLVNSPATDSVPLPAGSAPRIQKSVPFEPSQPADQHRNTDTDVPLLSSSHGVKGILSRASNLLRESLGVEGCLFLDSSAITFKDQPVSSAPNRKSMSMFQSRLLSESENGEAMMSDTTDDESGKEVRLMKSEHSTTSTCEVLGCSLKFDRDANSSTVKEQFKFSHDFLRRLARRHPTGTILNFESDGRLSSSDNDIDPLLNNGHLANEKRKSRKKETNSSLKRLDVQTIIAAFTGVRCLAFFPIREPGSDSWLYALFAWTNNPMRVLDPVDDLAYLSAFGNSIVAEKSRLEAVIADKMKTDFMSTVSHELRSPLHGILASAELLTGLSTTVAQNDILNMIDTCGRTLLDTINHVLDFTELTHSREHSSSRPRSVGDGKASSQKSITASSHIEQVVNIDLSKLVEEAVECTLLGYDYSHSEATAIADINHQGQASNTNSNVDDLVRSHPRIQVILDVEACASWHFAWSPGAWRRILMNLFGNSLKYTRDGYIYVSLRRVTGKHGRSSVILSVKDTGRGMSVQFLERHAFTPFVQEDPFVVGTGLGLSIVQRIVHDINGEISIQSERGAGTEITVQVPMPQSYPDSDKLNNDNDDERLRSVIARLRSMKVCLVSSSSMLDGDTTTCPTNGQNVPSSSREGSAHLLERTLVETLTHWFKLQIVKSSSVLEQDADLYLLLGDQLDRLIGSQGESGAPSSVEQLTHPDIGQKIIVLSTAASATRHGGSHFWKSTQFVQQPFGPRKLARALDSFLSTRTTTQAMVQRAPMIHSSQPLTDVDSPLSTLASIDMSPKKNSPLASQEPPRPSPSIIPIPLPIDANRLQDAILAPRGQVLLVEDNEINMKLLVMYMRKLNISHHTAVNGLEAFQLYKEHYAALRLIITDISMPVMDGAESTSKIRQFERERGITPVNIVALTGVSSIRAQEKVIASGVDKFVTKPMPLAMVKELVLQSGIY